MTLSEHERQARRALRLAGVDSPELCGRLLAQRAFGLDHIKLVLAGERQAEPEEAARLARLVQRRSLGEPLAYILGKREFYGRDFLVSPATLIPRPETELLIEAALDLAGQGSATFADLGCGSGCIGLTLLCERPAWRGLLCDISPQALAVAAANAGQLGCEAAFLLADMRAPPLKPASLDLVISNPPYIATWDKRNVLPETLAWEPHLALFSEQDGLGHLQAAITAGQICLKPGGWLIVEHGWRQRAAVQTLFSRDGFTNLRGLNDLAGLPRCVCGQKGKLNGSIKRFRVDRD